MDNQYYAGKGCECFARYQGDCCCEDADWTPKEVYILRKRIAELEVIAKAVAHIGVDFGYGVYEIENKHIEDARQYFLTKDGNL